MTTLIGELHAFFSCVASETCVEFDGGGSFNETVNATSPVKEFWE